MHIVKTKYFMERRGIHIRALLSYSVITYKQYWLYRQAQLLYAHGGFEFIRIVRGMLFKFLWYSYDSYASTHACELAFK
jgi:hypothetical protein